MTLFTRLTTAALMICSFAAAPQAQERTPLPMEGKSTVYQRVLAKKGASLHESAGGAGASAIRPFQPFYVYGRGDNGWLEVGPSPSAGPTGWVEAAKMVEWRQNIVASFANPAGRERQLLFEGEAPLLELLNHEAAISMAQEMRSTLLSKGAGSVEDVVSVEPEDYVDISKNFYLLPILDWKMHEHPMTFELIRTMKLASLTLDEGNVLIEPPKPLTTGVVFVIDTSRSMQPYIDATRETVTEIIEQIRNSEAGERIRFGAIGFRDSVEAAKAVDPARDVEYRTRHFVELGADQKPEDVLAGFSRIKQAEASTIGFAEDATSGVLEAISLPGWENGAEDGGPIKLRYVVVISDASPKPPGDESLPAEIRDLDPASIADKARVKGVTLMALHMKTPDGAANHEVARKAYSQLTRAAAGGSLYYPVDLSSPSDLKAAMKPYIEKISKFVASEYAVSTEKLRAEAKERALTPMEEASLVMRLAWLGRDRDAKAESLIEAWAMDRSLENPLLPALDFRLLVTRNELATMSDVLRNIVETGEQTQGDMKAGEFFELLRGALARISRNPGVLVNTSFETLDEAIGEFLDDLPYESPILADITQEKWLNMGSERRAILDRVRSRLQLYEHFHDDASLWTALYDGAPDGEYVFAMPIETLP